MTSNEGYHLYPDELSNVILCAVMKRNLKGAQSFIPESCYYFPQLRITILLCIDSKNILRVTNKKHVHIYRSVKALNVKV